MKRVPTYSALLRRTDAPAGSSWGVFGTDDELGTLNFMTSGRILDAIGTVRRGIHFSLDYEINAFPPNPHRRAARHVMFGRHEDQRDDYLDSFFLQNTSQIDGLRHRRHSQHGFYNGFPDDSVREGTTTLGIQHWANTGIIGRGVVVDVKGYLARRGRRLDYDAGEAFTVSLLDHIATEQDLKFRPGDILLIRTGWAEWFLKELTEEERIGRRATGVKAPGLIQARATLRWLWDHQFTMVAADNVAVEAVPVADAEPFFTNTDRGLMHQEMIAMLGLALGELFRLDDLADDCNATQQFDCLVVCKPLALQGGVGSTANCLAIK